MSTPVGDHAFLHELEVNVSTELTLARTRQPETETRVAGEPVEEQVPDPDAQRYEVRLRSLLGAVEALQRPGSRAGER
jgi:hypothetical protein